MESIIPMTAGLLLDICGVFLILRPFLYGLKQLLALERVWFLTNFSDTETDWSNLISNIAKSQLNNFRTNYDMVYWGFGFLSSGFILILIASWINYIETW